jgi:hypothetical protein
LAHCPADERANIGAEWSAIGGTECAALGTAYLRTDSAANIIDTDLSTDHHAVNAADLHPLCNAKYSAHEPAHGTAVIAAYFFRAERPAISSTNCAADALALRGTKRTAI